MEKKMANGAKKDSIEKEEVWTDAMLRESSCKQSKVIELKRIV